MKRNIYLVIFGVKYCDRGGVIFRKTGNVWRKLLRPSQTLCDIFDRHTEIA